MHPAGKEPSREYHSDPDIPAQVDSAQLQDASVLLLGRLKNCGEWHSTYAQNRPMAASQSRALQYMAATRANLDRWDARDL